VTLDSLPGREFAAVYKEHSTQPDPKTLTYQVTLSIPRPPELNLLPGMSATVKVDFAQIVRNPDTRILVPVEAVFSPDNGPATAKQVWVVSAVEGGMTVTARPVEVGQLTRNGIEVLRGLTPGEQIVAVGGAELEQGQAVRPWVRERGL
jgi:RND family efflux transporter MFP subunit